MRMGKGKPLDLFEVYPQLAEWENEALHHRSLRLIAIAGFVYDEESFYFELGQPRHWGRLPDGGVSIGVSAPKVQPDSVFPPYRALVRHLVQAWRWQVDLFPAGHSYVLDELGGVHVLAGTDAHLPYLFLLTPPRLGGADVPDALVQAVYLLPIRRVRRSMETGGLLRVERAALRDFLAPDQWLMHDIVERPWAEVLRSGPLPEGAYLKPVLALRGLRSLIEAGALPGIAMEDGVLPS